MLRQQTDKTPHVKVTPLICLQSEHTDQHQTEVNFGIWSDIKNHHLIAPNHRPPQMDQEHTFPAGEPEANFLTLSSLGEKLKPSIATSHRIPEDHKEMSIFWCLKGLQETRRGAFYKRMYG